MGLQAKYIKETCAPSPVFISSLRLFWSLSCNWRCRCYTAGWPIVCWLRHSPSVFRLKGLEDMNPSIGESHRKFIWLWWMSSNYKRVNIGAADTSWQISRGIYTATWSEVCSNKHTNSCIQKAGIYQLAITWERCMRYRSRRITWDPLFHAV